MEYYEKLTPREQDILECLVERMSYREIAERLTLSPNSVKWYASHIYGKLGVSSRSEAVVRARALGLVGEPDPAAVPVPAARDNLPVELTSLIGREEELDEIAGLLDRPGGRLVTLTGSGGCGKTRLALRAGANQRENFRHGVWLIELAALTGPDMVPQAAAAALGLLPDAGQPVTDALLAFLRSRRTLLILDNCEHLIEAAARLALAILRACPDVQILATSREPLRVPGEVTFRVPSLPVPPEGWDGGAAVPAAELFLERAGAARAGIAPAGWGDAAADTGALARICRRLDGIPLAIELAAARASALSLAAIADRLEESFALLSDGSRALLPRQQTLRASIEWSYRLLSAQEQALLARLAVFSGGWTLEAVEEIWDAGGDLETGAAGLLSALVNKSLIGVGNSGPRPRYRMLETIRQYAWERLRAEGDAEEAQARHLAYYCRLAETLEPNLRGPDQVELLDRLEEELENIRAALGFALEHPGKLEQGLRLACALRWLWNNRTMHGEGAAWLRELLAAQSGAGEPLPPAVRARALVDSVYFHLVSRSESTGDMGAMLEESRAIYESLGEAGKRGLIWVLYNLDAYYYDLGDIHRGTRYSDQMLALAEEIGDRFGLAQALDSRISYIADPNETLRAITRAVELRREIGDIDGLSNSLFYRSHINWRRLGAVEEAWRDGQEALEYARQIKNVWVVSRVLLFLGWASCLEGDAERGRALLLEALQVARATGNESRIGSRLVILAATNVWRNHCDRTGLPTRPYFAEALAIARRNGYKLLEADALFYQAEEAWAGQPEPANGEAFSTAAAAYASVAGQNAEGMRLYCLGKAAFTAGNPAQARGHFREALRLAVEGAFEQWDVLQYLAAFTAADAACAGTGARAARLQGAVDALRPHTRIYDISANRLYLPFPAQAVLERARAALGEAECDRAYADGQGLTLMEAADAALAGELEPLD